MPIVAVGQLYVPGRTSWPEAAEYNFGGNGHELRLFYAKPSLAEIKSAKSAPVHLGLFFEGPLIVLAYRIDGLCAWSDAPYSWHLVPPTHRALPPPPDGRSHALLHLVLVDSSTGVVRALRVVSLTPSATSSLHSAILAQAALPWDAAAYDDALAGLYRRFPTSGDIARGAQTLLTGGH